MNDLTKTNSGPNNFCPREHCPHVLKLMCPHYGEEGACYTVPEDDHDESHPPKKKGRR